LPMYRLFDAVVASDLPLPGVPRVPGGRELDADEAGPDIVVRHGGPQPAGDGADSQHCWRDRDGNPVLSCRRLDAGDEAAAHCLHFPGLAEFRVTAREILCHPAPGCREDTLRHLLLNQVMPRVWAHRGYLVLHASAVQLADGRVMAFAGDTGRGKSTLAAALVEQGAQGAPGVRVVPAYGGLRLLPDSIAALDLEAQHWPAVAHYSAKRQQLAGAPAAGSSRLDSLYFLEEPVDVAGPVITPLTGVSPLPALLRQSFVLDVHDTGDARRQMALAAEVLRQAPAVYSLAYRRDYRELTALCEALLSRPGECR
jgi:hypothetical protein